MRPVINLVALPLSARAFGSARVGAGGGAPAAALASLVTRACAHPALAAGALHWLRHALLDPAIADDPRVMPASAMLGRAALTLADAWPLLGLGALAALRQCLVFTPAVASNGDIMAHREACVAAMADLLLSGAAALPTLAYVRAQAEAGAWDASLLRRFLAHALAGLALPLSPPFALELVRCVHATQDRVVAAARAAKAAAAAGRTAGDAAAVVAAAVPAAPTARRDLQSLLERLYRGTAAAAEGAGAGATPEEEPATGAPLAACESLRAETRRLILEINTLWRESDILI